MNGAKSRSPEPMGPLKCNTNAPPPDGDQTKSHLLVLPGPSSLPIKTEGPAAIDLKFAHRLMVKSLEPNAQRSLSGTCTKSSTPSKLNALPITPGANVAPFMSVPLL